MKNILLILFCNFLFQGVICAQSGAVLSVGMTLGYPDSPLLGSKNAAQSGWHTSLTTRLGDDFWYWRLGLELHKISLKSRSTYNPFADQAYAYFIKLPIQLCARVYRNNQFSVRAMAGGVGSYVWSIQDNDYGLNHNTINDVQVGALLGAGIDLGPLAIDFNFEKGLSELYTGTKYKSDYCYLSMGFFF